jgi:hypothetical protein
VQVKIHGSVTNTNKCTSSLLPALQPPDPNAKVTLTLSTDAFPQPHKGEPITLSNTKATINVDKALLQLGVTSGLVTDGMQIPSTATLVVTGSGTTEGTHTYKVTGTSTVHVVNGQAQPLVATSALPNTTWHPKNATDPVIFTEKSLNIAAGLDILLGHVDVTIACSPVGTAVLAALAAQGNDVPTIASTVPVSIQGSTTTTTTKSTVATPVGAGSLPRTGGSTLLLLVVAAVMLDLGLCGIAFGRRRTRHI